MDGIKVYRHIRTVNMRYLFGLLYMASTLLFLYRLRHQYQLIHCHQAHSLHALVALILKKPLGKKVIVKVASSGLTSDFVSLKRSLLKGPHLRYLRSADQVISVCRESTQEILGYGFSRNILAEIPNGVDIAALTPAPLNRGTTARLTFVGRLSPEKGIHVLLQAVKILVERGSRVQLTIVGGGPEEGRLKEYALRRGLGSSTVFYGETAEVDKVLMATDAFILPSLSEGLSSALLEAMACGLPVVATAVGGTRDVLIDHENGLLVPPGDADKMAGAIGEIIHSRELATHLGRRARETVEREFSLEAVISRYTEIYERLLGST
jgi:glycosyltransferase involved in cell wall biosynthesis